MRSLLWVFLVGVGLVAAGDAQRQRLPDPIPVDGFQQLLPHGGIPALIDPEFVEAFFANHHALMHSIENKLGHQRGMNFDKNVVVLYGDPGWVFPDPDARAGTLDGFHFRSSAFGDVREAKVWLPHEFKKHRTFRLLVVHDGDDYLKYTGLRTVLENLVHRHEIMPLIAPSSEFGLEAFFRYEYLDTQADIPSGYMRDRSQPRRLYIPGLQFRPHPEVVIKLDYRRIEDWEGEAADEISVGFGLVF